MKPDLEHFNQLVLNNKKERLRLALVGDALLRFYTIKVALEKWPEKTAGQITMHIQPMQQNDYFGMYMRVHGVKIPGGLKGKSVADYFEAWVGYLHEDCGPWFAIDFCINYIESELQNMEPNRNILDLTSELLELENV